MFRPAFGLPRHCQGRFGETSGPRSLSYAAVVTMRSEDPSSPFYAEDEDRPCRVWFLSG